MTRRLQANSPSNGPRPLRSGWVGPVVIGLLVIVWTFCLWTYDRQVVHRWRADRDERLDLLCQMVGTAISRSVRQDFAGLQQMLLIWLSDQETPNEVVREEQVTAAARRHGFADFRVLERHLGGPWITVAGNRRRPDGPALPLHAERAVRQSLAVGPLTPLDPQRAEATVYAGALRDSRVEVVVEARWEITPAKLIESLPPTLLNDLDQIRWGLRDRTGAEILAAGGPGITGPATAGSVVAEVDLSPWFLWHLSVLPRSSWYAPEAHLRRAVWIFGLLAMAVSVGLLLYIEAKNKALIRLTSRSVEAAAFLETVLDGVEDYSIIATDLAGRIVSANRGTERIYGHAPPDLVGQPIALLSHPQAPATDRLDAILRATLETRRYDDVVVVRRADGTMVHVQLSCAVRTGADGQPTGFVLITHDVTALLDRTVRLEQLNAQLAEQTRMARRANRLINEFLANMSHELRTPLNAIIGYTRLVQRKTQDLIPPRQSENLGRILQASESLLRLINDLLDLSKIEAGRMPILCEPVNLRALAEDVVETVRPLAEGQHTQIVVTAPGDLPPMVSDSHHLRQILINLVANAIKFTSKGAIEIALRPGQDPDTVQIAVTDTGIGIPEEHLPHIFEAFYQVDGSTTRSQGGTGLGLSIVQRLVHQLGGQISVDSRVGEGSTFTVTLPRDISTATPPLAAPGTAEAMAPPA